MMEAMAEMPENRAAYVAIREVRGMLNPNPEVSVNIFFLKRIRECLTEVIHDISEKESLTHGDAEAVKKILQLMDFTEKDHVVEAAEYRRSHPGIQTPARSDSD